MRIVTVDLVYPINGKDWIKGYLKRSGVDGILISDGIEGGRTIFIPHTSIKFLEYSGY